ncbi:hypothetical protein B0T12DRAFT_97764 [Alternaria alternata]|nr:hypothetical protein B0T12DRAFT_97764 [Alternaria alternata]
MTKLPIFQMRIYNIPSASPARPDSGFCSAGNNQPTLPLPVRTSHRARALFPNQIALPVRSLQIEPASARSVDATAVQIDTGFAPLLFSCRLENFSAR